MKAKTKIRFKRTIASVLCMMMLASNLLVTNAATTGCTHTNYRVNGTPSPIGATSLSSSQHNARYAESRICLSCNTEFTGIREVTEDHSLEYIDEGHMSVNAHGYRVHCSKCDFSQSFAISCPGGSSHVKP